MVRGIDTEDLPATGGGGGKFIRDLKVKGDGESVRLWFLTNGDDVFLEAFHWCNNAEKGEKHQLCAKSLGQACVNCELSEEKDSPVGPARTEIFLWVYVLEHYYVDKPSGASKKVRIGSQVLYKVEVNAPFFMRYSIAHRPAIKNRWERHGTLLDRPFFWIRAGEKNNTRYELEPCDKEKMPADVRELMKTLPDNEDVALGRVDKLDGEADEEETSSYSVRDVEDDEEEGEEKGNEFAQEVVEEPEDEEPEDEEPDDEEPEEEQDDGDTETNPFD